MHTGLRDFQFFSTRGGLRNCTSSAGGRQERRFDIGFATGHPVKRSRLPQILDLTFLTEVKALFQGFVDLYNQNFSILS